MIKLLNLKFKTSVVDKGISLRNLFMENKELRLLEETLEKDPLFKKRREKDRKTERNEGWIKGQLAVGCLTMPLIP